jgi:hypothetical protein
MMKPSFIFVAVIALVIFSMMMDQAMAGDCNGSRCGCYKGYCWAYVDGAHTSQGDYWCYTQMYGIKDKQSVWQTCISDVDCYWDRTCGNCNQYTGSEQNLQIVC